MAQAELKGPAASAPHARRHLHALRELKSVANPESLAGLGHLRLQKPLLIPLQQAGILLLSPEGSTNASTTRRRADRCIVSHRAVCTRRHLRPGVAHHPDGQHLPGQRRAACVWPRVLAAAAGRPRAVVHRAGQVVSGRRLHGQRDGSPDRRWHHQLRLPGGALRHRLDERRGGDPDRRGLAERQRQREGAHRHSDLHLDRRALPRRRTEDRDARRRERDHRPGLPAGRGHSRLDARPHLAQQLA